MKKTDNNDRKVLKELAKRYRAIADLDEMKRKIDLWRGLHDLKPERPMILFEPISLEGYLLDYDLQCKDAELRNVETRLIYQIRQFEQLGDDIVLEPYFRIAWRGSNIRALSSIYGDIKIEEQRANTPSMAYLSSFPIKTPDDIERLKPRHFTIEKISSLSFKEKLEDIFKEILPVRLTNFDNFYQTNGNQPFTGNNCIGITHDLFRLIGAKNMMLWIYDYPEAVRRICRFIADDRKSFYRFMARESLLGFNSDNQFAGPSSYGYVSQLPSVDSCKKVELKDLWCYAESQEAQPFSPAMFNEFFLPYIAEVANEFGLTYYGCCENVTDRFEYIVKAIPNLRTVSISGWSNIEKAGEMLGKKYVCSRKPVPAYVSTESAHWELVEKEAKKTRKATREGCIEIIFRDAYSKNITVDRVKEWIRIYKREMGIA